MARPFYPHEVDDPDLDWLVSNFLFERPDFVPVESGMLPLVLLPYTEVEGSDELVMSPEEVCAEECIGEEEMPAETEAS